MLVASLPFTGCEARQKIRHWVRVPKPGLVAGCWQAGSLECWPDSSENGVIRNGYCVVFGLFVSKDTHADHLKLQEYCFHHLASTRAESYSRLAATAEFASRDLDSFPLDFSALKILSQLSRHNGSNAHFSYSNPNVSPKFKPVEWALTYLSHSIDCGLPNFMRQVIPFDESYTMLPSHCTFHIDCTINHSVHDILDYLSLLVVEEDDGLPN